MIRQLLVRSIAASVTTLVCAVVVLIPVAGADEVPALPAPPAPPSGIAESIVVTAKRVVVPDDIVTARVETALHENPYFYDEHVTVTVRDGIAHLQGTVFDDWDLRIAMGTARKIHGVRRVVNELEISSTGAD